MHDLPFLLGSTRDILFARHTPLLVFLYLHMLAKLIKQSWQQISLPWAHWVCLAMLLIPPSLLATISDFSLVTMGSKAQIAFSLLGFFLICLALLWAPRALAEPALTVPSLLPKVLRALPLMTIFVFLLVLINIIAMSAQTLVLSHAGSTLLKTLPPALSLSARAQILAGLVTVLCVMPVLFVLSRLFVTPFFLTSPRHGLWVSLGLSWQKTKKKMWPTLGAIFLPLIPVSWLSFALLRQLPELLDTSEARWAMLILGTALRLAATLGALVYLSSLAILLTKSPSVGKRPV